MALCLRHTGSWRSIKAHQSRVSGSWRATKTGCIKVSGTWRLFCNFQDFNADLANCPLGSCVEGGTLLCKSGGVAMIVARANTQVTTCWGSINAAVTNAQNSTGCTGWFIPNRPTLVNPGWVCRQYWDSYTTSGECRYWSSTFECAVRFTDGFNWNYNQLCSFRVRAFRCVLY